MFHASSYLLVASIISLAAGKCECGYKTNTAEVYQFALETTFNNHNSTAQFRQSTDWEITDVVYDESDSRPIATNYTSANVNVVGNALQLTCSAYNASKSDSIHSAQIKTRRDDILHGSFRATFNVAGSSTGVVSAIFFYASDTQEVDIELLTRQDPRAVSFTNQPGDAVGVYMPNGLKRTDNNNYRLDWTPTKTAFYVNNVLSSTISSDVPVSNGSVFLNSWGGSLFSGKTPPAKDVVMSVTGIQLYFNTSDAALSRSWSQTCSKAKSKVCNVDQAALMQNTTAASSGSKVRPNTPTSFQEWASSVANWWRWWA